MVPASADPLAETISHAYPPKFPSVPKSLESDLELRLILSLGQGDSDVQYQCKPARLAAQDSSARGPFSWICRLHIFSEDL